MYGQVEEDGGVVDGVELRPPPRTVTVPPRAVTVRIVMATSEVSRG
ncbi:hypothetical protein M0655_00525 [Gordonia amicalis]|nr:MULTISPECIES: hypothetical protein [Gordonia]UPW16379.1 hypothetical protein M0655_00525 [Gordonia amicalis]